MLKIVAVMLIFAPGMQEPQKKEVPVGSLEECQGEIAKMIEAVQIAKGKEFKALLACQVSSEKSDPA